MRGDGPVLVYSKYAWDLDRFKRVLEPALPQVSFHYAGTPEEAQAVLPNAEVVYGWGFGAELLRQMPNLRWVQKMGAGVEDLVGAWSFGSDVLLTRTDGRLIAPRMVEYVLGAILQQSLQLPLARKLQAERRWDYFEMGSVRQLTVGIAGLGQIGSEIARTLRFLGARVLGWRRSESGSDTVDQLFTGTAELNAFVGQCDVLVLVLPLTQDTQNIVDADVLAQCRPGMHLINIGRGKVVDEDVLLAALDDKRISHATLDVFATEPLPHDHPFWTHRSVSMTPHVCGPLVPEEVAPHFIENFAAYVAGRPMRNIVDIEKQY